MTESPNQSTTWPSRPQRILALTKSLVDDLESVDINVIDGEFYWRICRDDLLDPISQLAASIAPHIVDAGKYNDQLDDVQRQEIDEYTRRLAELDDETQERLIERFKLALKAEELFSAGRPSVEQLPESVWEYYSTRRRIPMRAPLRIAFGEGGHVIEVRVYSRGVIGAALDDFIRSFPGRRYLPRDPEPRSGTALDDLLMQETAPQPVSVSSLHLDFALVTARAAPPQPESSTQLEDLPYVYIRLRRPIPPQGVISTAYDKIVRDWHQWHLQLPGAESLQDKTVVIRIWAIGLLMREGNSFQRTLRELEPLMGYLDLSQEADRQARNRLLERVPEARACLGPR
jgi:hypothetical protein